MFGPAPAPGTSAGSPTQPGPSTSSPTQPGPSKTPTKSEGSSGGAASGGGCGDFNLEQERQLPGVVMACQGTEVFSMLYRLAQLDDQK